MISVLLLFTFHIVTVRSSISGIQFTQNDPHPAVKQFPLRLSTPRHLSSICYIWWIQFHFQIGVVVVVIAW